jgi:hypothetical protein
MSSRLARTLLKLYPRRVRDRYGDELLDLQDELSAQGDVSRKRLARDMLAGALLARPVSRARLITGAVLVIGALALAGTIIGGRGTDSPAPASHPRVRLATKSINVMPYGSCFVAGGSSCSVTPCHEFTGRPSAEGAVVYNNPPAARRLPRPGTTRCAEYPRAGSHHTVFVGD